MTDVRFNAYHMTSLIIALTIVFSSLAFLFSNEYRTFPHFISEADVGLLPSLLFKGGFGLSSFAMTWMMVSSTRRLVERKETRPRQFAAMTLGSIAVLSLWFVIMYDLHSNIKIHTVAAGLCFISSILWTKVYGSAIGIESNLFRKGLSFSAGGCVAMTGALLIAPNYSSHLDTNAYLDSIQHFIMVAAPAEFALVAGLLVSIYALGNEESEKNSESEKT
ncbi:MAG: hypothetical protein O2866_04980 [archaeon]|nr:hypothetical protein [archaeon]MDA1168218.1 hypothetical protein [archaeon]